MKRQTRPFVVEVKRKRGDATRKQSIWGRLDLSAITAETAERLEEIEPRQLQEKAAELAASEDVAASTSATALPTAQIDQGDDVSDLQVAPTEEANIEQVHPRTPRMRRGGAETLPRGQRWKRRLPKVLRRRT